MGAISRSFGRLTFLVPPMAGTASTAPAGWMQYWGPRHQPVREAEVEAQFRDRRHEAGDPRLRARRRMARPGGVGQHGSAIDVGRAAYSLTQTLVISV